MCLIWMEKNIYFDAVYYETIDHIPLSILESDEYNCGKIKFVVIKYANLGKTFIFSTTDDIYIVK